MAEYRVILNIGGNAVRQMEKFADTLQRADKHAKDLSKDLRGMPSLSGDGGGIGASAGSSIVKRGVGGIAGAIMSAVSLAVKGVFTSTKIGYTMGWEVTRRLADVLQGQQMGEAIRYMQRRTQIRYSLGARAVESIDYANQLATSYGLNRGTTLGSLNVLTGLRVGGAGEEIDAKTAASIVKVGGLIAQQGGYSYERVMTNFQQLFANSLPSKRDIREMLGQAPVLARYATEEIQKRGLTGKMDMYDYYKSHENILRSLARYEVENPVTPAAFARGRLLVAQQDIYNRLAENPSWGNVAANYVGVLETFGKAINDIVTTLSNSPELQNSINGLIGLIEAIGKNQGWMLNLMTTAGEELEKYFGVRLEDVPREERTQRQNTVAAIFDVPANKEEAYRRWRVRYAKGLSEDENVNRESFESWYLNARSLQKTYNSELYKAVRAPENLKIVPSYDITGAGMGLAVGSSAAYFTKEQKEQLKNLVLLTQHPTTEGVVSAPYKFDINAHAQEYQFMQLSNAAFLSWIDKYLNEGLTMKTDINGGAGLDNGSDFGGFNKDRRSLEIHFHAPIVEWKSEISTNDPRKVVDAVENNIEGAASRAIQIALLGASQKMSTRWL